MVIKANFLKGPTMDVSFEPKNPRVVKSSVAEAYRIALASNEPIFHPVDAFIDDRGWSLMNQLQSVLSADGQINFSLQYPGVIKAWHRHALQTDFWLVVGGSLKVGVTTPNYDVRWQITLGVIRPGVLIIPPSLWHGAATVGPTSACLLYYVTKAFNPDDPDEERIDHDSVPNFKWGTEHR